MSNFLSYWHQSLRTCLQRAFGFQVFLAIAAFVLFAAPATADDATDRLLGLVRSDASAVIEFPDLETQLERARQSEFVNRLVSSELYKTWAASNPLSSLVKLGQSTEKATNKSMDVLTKELFGTGVVLALFKTGRDKYSSIVLTEADSVEFLDEAIQSWNASEKLETRTHSYKDQDYFERMRLREGRRPESLYYTRIDRVFVLTDKEDLIKPVLELQQKRAQGNAAKGDGAAASAIIDSPVFRKSRAGIQSKPFANLYLNPRDFDHHVPLNDNGPRIERNLAKMWRRLDGISVSLKLDDGPVFEANVVYNNQGLSEEWTKIIASMQKPSGFMQSVPRDAVMAFATVQDTVALGEGIANIVATEDEDPEQWETFRRVSRGLLLGYDLLDDILPKVSSHIGGYAVPRQPDKPSLAGEIPIEALVVLNLPKFGEAAKGAPSVRDAIDNALSTALNVAAAYLNSSSDKPPVSVKSEERTGALLRWIDEIGGYRPAYTLTTNHLAIASTPDLARRFLDAPSTNTSGSPKRLASVLGKHFPNENQVGFIDVAAIRELLKQRRTSLIESAVESKSLSEEESAARMERLIDVAKILDTAFVAGHVGTDHIRVVFGGTVDQPESNGGPEGR